MLGHTSAGNVGGRYLKDVSKQVVKVSVRDLFVE